MKKKGISKDKKTSLSLTLNAIKSEVYTSKVNSNKYIDLLQDNAQAQTLTICIGSGITSQLVGEWNTLLNKIAKSLFYKKIIEHHTEGHHPYDTSSLSGKEIDAFLQSLWAGFPDSTSVLEKGEYLAAQCDRTPEEKIALLPFNDLFDSNPNWRELVFAEITLDASRRLIAENISKMSTRKGKTEERKIDLSKLEDNLIDFFLKTVRRKDKILNSGKEIPDTDNYKKIESLDAVLNLCFSGIIKHIINYNFDTILETLLSSERVYNYYKKKGGKPLQLCVYNPFYDHEKPIDLFIKKDRIKNRFPIRIDHVHGLLDSRLKKIAPIVFSEESYINIKRAALHWSSLAIAKAVTDGVMLCIGFSGEDDDFRTICQRMMDNHQISYSKSTYPIAPVSPRIFLIASLNSRINKIVGPLKKNIEMLKREDISDNEKACTYEILISYIDMIERYFKDHLNVQIIWIKDRPDIPNLLQELISPTSH